MNHPIRSWKTWPFWALSMVFALGVACESKREASPTAVEGGDQATEQRNLPTPTKPEGKTAPDSTPVTAEPPAATAQAQTESGVHRDQESSSVRARPPAKMAKPGELFELDGQPKARQIPASPAPMPMPSIAQEKTKFDSSLGMRPNTVTPVPQSKPAEVAIDPNGRFATTYRPGGGHLAAFESAVARGIVPEAEREVVSDIGARYYPTMDPPTNAALAIKTEFERAKAPPNGSGQHLRISLRSTTESAGSRPQLSVHLVMDISGSMRGNPMTQARQAARSLVDKLDAKDDFSLVTFSSDADVRVEDGPVGPRRELIKKTIDGIAEGGGTNIGRGLELGYQQATSRTIPADAVKVVLLLSDGRANAGIISSDRLAKMALDAFQNGIQTSTFGLGTDYDGPLMSSIASDGAGGYYYLRDADQVAPALATEIEKRLDPVATAIELRIRLKPDVKLYQVYGSRRLSAAEASRVRAIEVAADAHAEKRDGIKKDRQDDIEGGMRFFIPAFARDDSHTMLIKLGLPQGVGTREVALIELKYKDRIAKKNVIDESPLKATFADSDAESASSVDMSVSKTVQGFAAGETLAEASRQIGLGDRQRAIALLEERESILRLAAQALKEPLFINDANRLLRLRSHAGLTTGMGDSLVLSMLIETASRTHMH